MISSSVADRFFNKVIRDSDPGKCWDWSGSKLKGSGYGRLNVAGKVEFAHRLSWEIHRGCIPSGMWVLHTCDNPPCSNPDHLYLGNHTQNVADRQDRGRTNAILDVDKVRQITTALLKGEPRLDVAKRFGVTRSTVNAVASGQNWAHAITDEELSYLKALPKTVPAIRGALNPNAVLTSEQVAEIKGRQGENRVKLSEEFGVSYSLIWKIQTGRARQNG